MRVIVTGGSGGIGRATAEALAGAGHDVVIASRDTAAGELAAEGMSGSVEVRKLDLADLAGVRRFADAIDGVDVLVNSAEVDGLPLRRTHAGFEYHIGVNHLGHFALTCRLGDKIADRVVSVSNAAHLGAAIDLDDLNWRRRPYSAVDAYRQSKLANLLFVDELARRGVRAYVADPDTATTLDAVDTALPSGSYLAPSYNQWGRRISDAKLVRRLWDLSVRLTDCDWRGDTSMPLLW